MWKNKYIVLIFSFIFIVSCKSVETIKVGKVSNITDAKLRGQLKRNQIDFDKLYLKKVQFLLDDGEKKRSFKGSFVIQKDSQIIVSIYALMGIELVRAKLQKNQLTILDKHNKIALLTDYDYLKKKYGVDFDFRTIQAILSNSLFLYPSEKEYFEGLKKYKHHIYDNHYSFKSIKDKRLGRLSRRSRNNIVVHQLDIYPEIFRIFKVFVKDFSANQAISIEYKKFRKFDSISFPEMVDFSANQGNSKINVNLKINYLEVNDGGSLHFKIPSSYDVKKL